MALPATDNFNRANGGLGANWTTTLFRSPLIVNNEVGTGGTQPNPDCASRWTADAPNNNQYSILTRAHIVDWQANAVRMDAADYVCLTSDDVGAQWLIEWYDGGNFIQIGAVWGVAPQDGDIGKIEAEGTTFRGFINGTQRIVGVNAGAPAAGTGGLYYYSDPDDDPSGRVDDFEVGNLVVGGHMTLWGRYWGP